MSDATYSVHDNGDLHRYRTEIPNIIFRLGLTPYELTLYAHLKQTAGDGGQCWKSTGTLAKETGMSAGTISKAKRGLSAPRQELGWKSLVSIYEEVGLRGGKPRHYIILADVGPETRMMPEWLEEIGPPPVPAGMGPRDARREWMSVRRRLSPLVFQAHGKRCVYCGSTDNMSVDHKMPLSRGGTNHLSNLVPACRSCNSSKHNQTEEEWIK